MSRSPACSPTMVAPRIRSVPGFGEHLDEAVGLAVGDGTVQVVDAVAVHVVGDVLRAGFLLAQAHPRDFRVGEGGPGHDAVVHPELAEGAEQRVHRRVPGHVRRRVRELEGPGHVAAGVDVRVVRLQVLVDLDAPCRPGCRVPPGRSRSVLATRPTAQRISSNGMRSAAATRLRPAGTSRRSPGPPAWPSCR